jgi:hypothetical protein
MIKTNYKIEELELKNNSYEEQERSRIIFESLKLKVSKGDALTEHEKDFFCMGVKLSTLNNGKIEDYACCDNFKFKGLYLTYFRNLAGGGTYFKSGPNNSYYKVSSDEANKDLKYLIEKANEWEATINITNHSSSILNSISQETRDDIKTLKNQPEFVNDQFSLGSFRFRYKKWAILLQSKYIYCTALEITEIFGTNDFIIKLNNKDIHFTDYSLIHILNRHFSQITKQYDTKKSFHKNDFYPKLLNKQILNILDLIDKSNLYIGQSLEQLNFQYNNIDYQIWIKERIRQEKGKGNVEYLRLETFYPIEDKAIIEDLKKNFDLEKITDDLQVYIKK